LGIVFMGSPQFAVPSLERLISDRYQVDAIYTQPDRPAGRGRAPSPTPVKVAAQSHGLTVVQPADLAAEGARLGELAPEVIVVAALGKMLPRTVLELPRHGCVNLHPSLLPKYRGASPVASAILAGDDITGVSLMLLDEGMDTGPLLGQERANIEPEDTAGSLTDKLSLVAAELLGTVLPRWLKGDIQPRPQDEAQASGSVLIAKGDGEIDWRLGADEIWRRVRAYQPWPGCYTRWAGKQIKILEAKPLPGAADIGRVVAAGDGLAVGTGDGLLGIARVQLEGKRALAAADFLRGQGGFLGAILK